VSRPILAWHFLPQRNPGDLETAITYEEADETSLAWVREEHGETDDDKEVA